MNEKKAIEAIENICDWLKLGAPGDVAGSSEVYESIPADLARHFASELLASADTDGASGCPLCQR